MQYNVTTKDSQCDLWLEGSFTYNDHANFRDIIALMDNKEVRTVTFHCEKLDFVDSAALGMLLLAREKAAMKGIQLVLHSPQGQVERLFTLSKFHTLFTVQAA